MEVEQKQLHTEDKDIFVGYGQSRIGGRAENQDSFGGAQTSRGYLLTVCDGMGGGPGGKTASSIAVKEIIAGVKGASADDTTSNVIIKAILRANMAIIAAGKEDPSLAGMGSTTTVLLLSDYSAFVAHVGDSRVYQLRGHRKVFRTFDHSMVFELVKQKVINEEQARLSAQSNIITRALGISPDLQVDITELSYEKGDRFALCTDGIFGSMPEKQLIKRLTARQPVGRVTDDVVTYVDNLGVNNGGEHDNLTLALLETKKESILRPTMTKKIKSVLMLLSAICVMSIALNVVQMVRYGGHHDEATSKEQASWQQKDSVQKQTIKTLQDSIARLNAANK